MRKWLCAWDLLFYHAGCALKAEFAKYRLHFLWWFLEPILNLGILYLVFGVFFASGVPNYALFLLTGLITWQWFANTVPHASRSIYGAMKMFQQFKVYPVHFPLCVFVQDTAKYLTVLAVFLLVVALLAPYPPSLLWFDLVPVMLVLALCVAGTAILVASLVPFLPDLAVVVPIIVQILFFASGIFFNIDGVVLPQHRLILYLNPNTVCIKSMRDILIGGHHPNWLLLGCAALISLAIFFLGLLLVTRCRKIYPRIINQ